MAVNSSTVTSKSVRLKAPDGTYHEATGVVYTQSNGEAVFSLSKPFLDPDKGIWEVYTSEQNRIADAAGNLLVLNEKIGEFEVPGSNPVTSTGGRTLYTIATVINAIAGDAIFIDKEGDIQFPTAPADGSEVQILDPWRKIKAGKNNVLLGTGDRWLLADGTYDTTPLTFTDNQLLGGSLTLKYSAPTKSWSAYPVYGSPVQVGGGQSTGGDRLVTALLALLPANQWTDWPALTGADAGKAITLDSIQSSSGDDWTNRLEVDRVRQRVRSLSRYTDVQFNYEVH